MTYFFLIPLICHFSLHLPQCSGHIDCSKLFYNKLKHIAKSIHYINIDYLHRSTKKLIEFKSVNIIVSMVRFSYDRNGCFIPVSIQA